MATTHTLMSIRSFALILIALLTVLTGCASAEDAPTSAAASADSLVIVVGSHQGTPAPGVPVELADILLTAVHAGAPLTVISADGSPEKTYRSADYTISDANPEASETDVNGQVNGLVAAVSAAAADSDGNDLGAALAIAADQVRADAAQHPVIVVIDNGISDRGFPDMTAEGMTTSVDPSSVVEFASSRDYLVTFPVTTSILLVGFGYTADPQPPITASQREHLIAVWSAVLEAGGAQVSALTTPRSGAGPKTAFATGILEPAEYEQITLTERNGRTEVALPSDVLFDFDDASLRDDEITDDALSELGDYLRGYSGPITVHGYADTVGDDAENFVLSKSRSISIGAWLIAHDIVAESQIHICGHGESDPAVPDAATEAEHQLNRRVVVALEEAPC